MVDDYQYVRQDDAPKRWPEAAGDADEKTGQMIFSGECVIPGAVFGWRLTTQAIGLVQLGALLWSLRLWQAGGGYVSTNSQDYDGSIAVKTLRGPWLLAAGLAFGTSLNSLQREAGQIRSTAASYGGSLRLRGAYDLAFEHWYLRPRFDLDLRYFNRPAFQESGISGLAMAFGGDSSIRPALAPALEIGGRFDIADDTILRPYLTIGATFLPDSSTSFQTWFVSGPLATLGTFQTTQSGPNAVANVEAGLQVYRARGFEAKADYALSTGTAWLSQTVALRGTWHF